MQAKTIQQPVVPVNYALHFDVKLEDEKDDENNNEDDGNKNSCYSGTGIITLKITKPTQKISLHAKGIKITDVSLNSEDKSYKIKNKRVEEENELITFDFGVKIKPSIVKLSLSFSAKLNNNLVGFYTSNYPGKDGAIKKMASTHLEPAHAREVFPCIDEPEAKATFDVSVTADKRADVTSNTPEIKKENLSDGRKKVTFETTPKMPTYLLYLGIGEFEYLDDKKENNKDRDKNDKNNDFNDDNKNNVANDDKNNLEEDNNLSETQIRIITVKGKSQYGKFAIEAAKKFLKFYEDYFGIRYPLKKLDLIAVPDFEAGAMENWGAITFREDALLYYPGTSSVADKEWIAQVIAHELVHQWFGNLVTMRWWNDLWLNESFADYMAFKAVDKYYPELEPWASFLSKNANNAFALDSLQSSHPIDIDVAKPHEVKEVFDAISYSKGGMVLRMLEKYIGEKAFQQGLSEYLKKFSYSNAEGKDLWEILEKVSGKQVGKLMKSWLTQTGHPLVDIDVEGNRLRVKQRRFLYLNKKTDATCWQIPILAYQEDNVIVNELLTKGSAEYSMQVDLLNDPVNLRINPERAAFCRVRYSKDLFDKIIHEIELGKIDAVDRWAIHNDLAALVFSGEVALKDYLKFVRALRDEEDYLVLMDVLGNLSRLNLLCSNEKFAEEIKKESRAIYEKTFERLGWDAKKDEKETDKVIRSAVIGGLGRLDDKEILERAGDMFRKMLKNPESVPGDLKATVYMLAAWQGDSEMYKKIVDRYEKGDNETENDRLLSALASFKDKSLLQKTLAYGLSDKVRLQNLAAVVLGIGSNPNGKELVWPWLRDNWTELKKRYEGPVLHLTRMISALSVVADMKIGKLAMDMMAKDPCPGTQRAIEQMLERMEINANFLERARKEFA